MTKTTADARHFSGTYAEARQKFIDAAALRGVDIESFEHPSLRGALGETLAIDVAYLGPPRADKMLIVSSGTHGPEGFCGSGCQVATLHDTDLLERVHKAELGLLLVHAINPHGFSHLHRTNEDNVDLNRNHIDFGRPLPCNEPYAEVEPFVVPANWPPTGADEAALSDYIVRHGVRRYRAAVSGGQHHSPGGVFYGGQAPAWSNDTMRRIVRIYGLSAAHIGWIDIHTGLGPCGHGEKIYAGRNLPSDLARARAWWGTDVFAPFDGDSVSVDVSGPVVTLSYDECPKAELALMGLEFGTLPADDVLWCLRADAWLRSHPQAPREQQLEIRQKLRNAFYCDNDVWKGMVLGQARVALLQAVQGLSAAMHD